MIDRDALDKLLEDHDECAWHLAARAPEEIAEVIYVVLQNRNCADPFKKEHGDCDVFREEGKCLERVPLDEVYISIVAELNVQAKPEEGRECSLFAVARDNSAMQNTGIFRKFALASISKYDCADCKDGKDKKCPGYDGGAK